VPSHSIALSIALSQAAKLKIEYEKEKKFLEKDEKGACYPSSPGI